MINTNKVLIFAAIIMLFLGCGEESSYTTTEQNDSTVIQTSSSFNGIVVDGYIKDADVCFDTNMDGVCTLDEQTTTTDTYGNYTFNMLEQNTTLVQIIASGGEDTSTDKSFSDKFVHILSYDELDENKTVIVSPINDLVAHAFNNSINTSLEDLEDAKNTIASMLGLSLEQLEQDPMLNIDIFALSQEIQHTKLLLEEICKKNIIDVNLSIIQDEIKKQIVEFDFNIERILIVLEGKLDFSAPINEKDFVIAQANELKNTLNSLAKDTSLSIDNLNRLQKSLNLKQEEAYILIQNADINSTLNVVELNITSESLTQTIFNTTNAIYDENGCVSQDGYNELMSNAFSPELVNDSINGISLKSNYLLGDDLDGSDVILYYPSITQNLSNNIIYVFEENINYYFTYDEAWVENTEQTVYVKTPKDTQGLYSCYRYQLSSTTTNDITPTKVFSYLELN